MKASKLYDFIHFAKTILAANDAKYKDDGKEGHRDRFNYWLRKKRDIAQAIIGRVEEKRKAEEPYIKYQKAQQDAIEMLDIKDKPVPVAFVECINKLFEAYAIHLNVLADTEIPDDELSELTTKLLSPKIRPETFARSGLADEAISLVFDEKELENESGPKG